MAIVKRMYKSRKTGKSSPRYLASVYNPETQAQEWGTSRKKRADAVQDEASMLEAIDRGEPIKASKKKFDDLATLWFESTKKDYAERTYDVYKNYYDNYIKDVFGGRSIGKINSAHIQKFKNVMNEDYAPSVVNKTLGIISLIMAFAVTLKLIKANPCDNIKRNKITPPKHGTWDEDTIGYFLSLEEVVRSKYYYEMLVFSFTVGARPGEVCGLSEAALLGDNRITLFKGLNLKGNDTEMKTDASHRPLSIDPFVYKLLEIRLEKKRKWRKEFIKDHGFDAYNENNYLFTYENGNPIRPDVLSKNYKRLVERHNENLKEGDQYLKKIRFYDARHSFATNSVLSKVNPKIISEIMGTSVETILKNYVHLGETVHQEALSNYSDKIFNIEDHKDNRVN